MIICIEGIDGSGKTTQARMLADRLRARLWKFPDVGTPTGKALYAHLEGHLRMTWQSPVEITDIRGAAGPEEAKKIVDGRMEERRRYREVLPEPDALAFQALQLANRMEHATEIFEAAARGHVVFDRYWPSGYAYGRADGLDGEWLIRLHSWLPQPDLFLLLDVDVEESTARRPERRDRYEADGPKLRQVAEHYRQLWSDSARVHPGRWRHLNARGSLVDVAASIEQAVADFRGGIIA